jgi:hypothetical protein
MDAASVDTFGAAVRVAALAMRDRRTRSLLLATSTGAPAGCILDGNRGGNEAATQRERWR